MANTNTTPYYYDHEDDEVVYEEECDLYENDSTNSDDEEVGSTALLPSQTQPSQTQQSQHHGPLLPPRRRRCRRRWNQRHQRQQHGVGIAKNDDAFEGDDRCYDSSSYSSGGESWNSSSGAPPPLPCEQGRYGGVDIEEEDKEGEEEENPFMALEALVKEHQMKHQQPGTGEGSSTTPIAGAATSATNRSCRADDGPQNQRDDQEERDVIDNNKSGAPATTSDASTTETAGAASTIRPSPPPSFPEGNETRGGDLLGNISSNADPTAAASSDAAGGPSDWLPDASSSKNHNDGALLRGQQQHHRKKNKRAAGRDNDGATSSSSLAVLEASRRFAAKKQRQRLRDDAATGRKFASSGTKIAKPVRVVRAKDSIVGSRPKHWGSQKTSKTTGRSLAAFTSSQRSHVRSELARAKDSRKRLAQRSNNSLAASSASGVETCSTPAPPPTVVSFAPAFLASRTATGHSSVASAPADDVEDMDDAKTDFRSTRNRQQNISPQYRPPAFASPTPPRRGGGAGGGNSSSRKQRYGRGKNGGGGSGPLLKRLKLIRDSIKGDVLRFQSGQYPFRKASMFDTNDPRNRAKSHVDVTILGESIPWEKEYQKLTFLSFVHEHHDRHRRKSQLPSGAASASADDTKNIAASNATLESTHAGPKACLAWLCFTFDTAREKNLQAGTNLRIYNPVVFPLQTSATTEAEATFAASSVQPPQANSVVNWMVLNTEICEHYPDLLPQLPDRAALLAQLQHHADSNSAAAKI